ncbi:MAG: uroporphyrinogen decarboxylase family protein [Elusimicrobiota bacterium]
MNERERLLKVLKGETPDRVPWFADLGHWYKAESGKQWDLFSINNCTKEIVDLHREVKAGWYIEIGSLHEEYYEDGVVREREINGDTARETFITPIGTIYMLRKWSSVSFSWDITKLMVENIDDLKVLLYTVERKKFKPKYENWEYIEKTGGDVGLGFPSIAYTGLGSLMSYYMGVEKTVYALCDEPELMKKYVDTYNLKHMELVEIYSKSPAPHIFFTDNLSGDVQSPDMFMEYSFNHYKNIADCLHKSGKTVSAHLDGRLNNIISIVAKAGIDVADACTPAPTGDLTPVEIRKQAGNDMVLMGGISPSMWLPETGENEFVAHVKEWLSLRKDSSRLVQSAGDQVPPGTELKRIKLVYDIVEEYGRY